MATADKPLAPYGEVARADLGRDGATYYTDDLARVKEEQAAALAHPKVMRATEMEWEDSPHGRIKHLFRPEQNPRLQDIESYMQELPPGGRSGKHRHMAEEFMFVLEGRGYSLHWDVDAEFGDTYHWVTAEPKRFDWEAGDWVYVPVNTIKQHFNSDPDARARFICTRSRVYRILGWDDLEQLEDAPGYAGDQEASDVSDAAEGRADG